MEDDLAGPIGLALPGGWRCGDLERRLLHHGVAGRLVLVAPATAGAYAASLVGSAPVSLTIAVVP
jgi:hypothetical protein